MILAPTSESRGGQKHPQPPPTAPDYCERSRNRNLCLPPTYSKFELPFVDDVNVVEIGIDISDVLRIDDKVRTTRGDRGGRVRRGICRVNLCLAWRAIFCKVVYRDRRQDVAVDMERN